MSETIQYALLSFEARPRVRVKIIASALPGSKPTVGPFKTLDIVEVHAAYQIGDATHYGPVVMITPDIPPFNQDTEQSVVVNLDPTTINSHPDESVYPKPPSSYNKIEFFPIQVDTFGYLNDEPPPLGTHKIADGLTIEDVSLLITDETFSLWTKDCHVSRDTAEALRHVKYAIAYRYTSSSERDTELDGHSAQTVNEAISCLQLIRPTRRSMAMNVPGIVRGNGSIDAHGFSAIHDPADVPEVQKLFTIRSRDIELLRLIFPEFRRLYARDDNGELRDYEPLRMAIQLYELGYSLTAWKPRHILWWSAIEALYGSNEITAQARIYGFFGNKDLRGGANSTIYENGDIPSCYTPVKDGLHTLGTTLPKIYAVRNDSAHGQRVPDIYFSNVPHPFGTAPFLDVLAEAATLIIRKTVVEVLRRGWRHKFKDPQTRDNFWLLEYGLDKHQSKKRLRDAGLL
jgi:hypothetical protein